MAKQNGPDFSPRNYLFAGRAVQLPQAAAFAVARVGRTRAGPADAHRAILELGDLAEGTTLPKCPETVAVSGPYFRDRNADYRAKAAGISNGLPAAANIVLHYFYHPFETASATGFDPPLGGAPYSGTECLPWLDNYVGTPNVPINYNFIITWPDGVPELRLGETLVKPKFGLPNIANQCSVDVIYEQSGPGTLVQLYEPLALRVLPVNNLAGNKLPPEIVTQIDPADQKLIFMKAPLTLRKRLKFNPNTIPGQTIARIRLRLAPEEQASHRENSVSQHRRIQSSQKANSLGDHRLVLRSGNLCHHQAVPSGILGCSLFRD